MLGALIIVFREVIEAGLIVGIALAVTRGVRGSRQWIAAGVLVGVVGALLVAGFAEQLSAAMAGRGQELFNASVLGLAVAMLAWHNIWMARHGRELSRELSDVGRAVASGDKTFLALAVVVGVAVLREGSEVALFLYGILISGEFEFRCPCRRFRGSWPWRAGQLPDLLRAGDHSAAKAVRDHLGFGDIAGRRTRRAKRRLSTAGRASSPRCLGRFGTPRAFYQTTVCSDACCTRSSAIPISPPRCRASPISGRF